MSNGAFFNFTVPDGLIGILRGFRYELTPLFAGIATSDITGKLTVGNAATTDSFFGLFANGAQVPGYGTFQLGQQQNERTPCYVLAQSLDTISLILTFTGGYKGLVTTDINVQFYGNFLLNTGRPLVYEPGFSDPLPVYDRTAYQEKRERDLIETKAPKQSHASSPPQREAKAAIPKVRYSPINKGYVGVSSMSPTAHRAVPVYKRPTLNRYR